MTQIPRTTETSQSQAERRLMAPGILFVLLVLLSLPSAARAQTPGDTWVPAPTWHYVQLAPATALLPVRIVADDEPWAQVVHDVQQRLGARVAGREVRVGFYGHGAFVPRAAVQQDVRFVAALGVAAEMDVMLFPLWRFPERLPGRELPLQMLHEQFTTPGQPPGKTVVGVVTRTMRQLARDHRVTLAQAVVRLAEGIHAFHTQHMTPSLAAFSNSALMLVRLGQLLEAGTIAEGDGELAVADDVRHGVYVRNIVTFGYPLPQGAVTAALQQRVQGTFVNVVPTYCWQQLAGNFPLRGAVENVAVAWAPAHAGWPHLAPTGPEVAILGAFLGGRVDVRRLAAQVAPRVRGVGRVAKVVGEAVCDALPDVGRVVP